MKFQFEADIKKGQCYCCPFCEERAGKYMNYCRLDMRATVMEVEPDECPLEEYNGIEWHPYPQEKPNEDGLYLVTVKTAYADSIQWLNGEWYGYAERDVIAWAEMPEPYEKDGRGLHLKEHREELLGGIEAMTDEEVLHAFEKANEDTKDEEVGMMQTITWHPYPSEKPTGLPRLFYVWRHGFNRGFNMTYSEGWYMDGRRYEDVEWWAEMPEPSYMLIPNDNMLISTADEHVEKKTVRTNRDYMFSLPSHELAEFLYDVVFGNVGGMSTDSRRAVERWLDEECHMAKGGSK